MQMECLLDFCQDEKQFDYYDENLKLWRWLPNIVDVFGCSCQNGV